MVKYFKDKQLRDNIIRLINEEIRFTQPERGTIGNRVKIVNSKEITNTVVRDDCEINGAARLSDCTIMSSADASVYIGTGVICGICAYQRYPLIKNSGFMHKVADCYIVKNSQPIHSVVL